MSEINGENIRRIENNKLKYFFNIFIFAFAITIYKIEGKKIEVLR